MKFKLLILFSLAFATLVQAQQPTPAPTGCCSGNNFVSNGGFESGGTLGSNFLGNATDWLNIFTNPNSRADYWGTSSNASNPVDQPTIKPKNGQRWAGLWARGGCAATNLDYRQAIKGRLSQQIPPNSGKYCLQIDLAKDVAHGWNGTGWISVFGYKGSIPNITNSTGNCNTNNMGLLVANGLQNFQGLGMFKYSSLTNTFQTFSDKFDTSTWADYIDGIIITRYDEYTGMAYIFIDNVEIKKYISPCIK